MRLGELQTLLRADAFRYSGGRLGLVRTFLRFPGFRYTATLRLAAFLREAPARGYGLFYLVGMWLARLSIVYGVHIPNHTRIGPGLYLGHVGGIFVNGEVVIGANCNLSQGVTLGVGGTGGRRGCPVIGDEVYLGPGSVVFGPVRVGDRAAVGANAVVSRDVEPGASVGGIPATRISEHGSRGLIQHPWPPANGGDAAREGLGREIR